MANVANLEKKLLKLINNKDSFAIALTGEWGIGKTRFWNNFYEENHTDLGVNKYSYVSLFGIDSIEALKFEIALSTHETTQKKRLPLRSQRYLQKELGCHRFAKA